MLRIEIRALLYEPVACGLDDAYEKLGNVYGASLSVVYLEIPFTPIDD
ncbi:hypothetical protein PSECIP111854_04122 [Pseudoalteromonas sp. CIP111854]|uniref:Uncharacterized protein n=1 Tax=Pseudoalteromonas holothuriae TaxID=2963714 RepID=A0A9W4R5H5_9GAMM|nr:hypothetical protein PSECIP111854_04122 [Pseudoalteromonas sp. CIP111854]